MRRVCVFCGSRPGVDPAFMGAASALGTTIASRGLSLVYGGASVGLMGAVADAALSGGASVTGVIPAALRDRELAHEGLSQLHVVSTMHERKARMGELSDAFIALPGGGGTLEEFFEVFTWAQLGIHKKPLGLMSTRRFYAPLLEFLDGAVSEGFLPERDRAYIHVAEDPEELLSALANDPCSDRPQWLRADQT